MVRHRLRNVVCVLAMAVVPALVPSPALASISGEVAFECEVTMPAFPTPGGAGECGDGRLPARAQVGAAGVSDEGTAYLVQGVGRTHAVFEYQTSCIANEPPLVGTVRGHAIVWDLLAVNGGILTTATLHLDFTANFEGPNMLILTSNHRLYFATGGSATGVIGGSGRGTFAPLLTASNVCPVGGPLKGHVEGEVDLPL